jgi:hypothetical protein
MSRHRSTGSVKIKRDADGWLIVRSEVRRWRPWIAFIPTGGSRRFHTERGAGRFKERYMKRNA